MELDVTKLLQPGANQLAIAAVNGGDKPNPAGLIGRLSITFDSGATLLERVGKTWKCSSKTSDGWPQAGFDDTTWHPAREVAKLGAGPWGVLGGNLTLSPVKADPFFGHCEVDNADLRNARVYLELGPLSPETAARVTVNGAAAGGFIGKPARLDVTPLVTFGTNQFRIEPFAPESARLVLR